MGTTGRSILSVGVALLAFAGGCASGGGDIETGRGDAGFGGGGSDGGRRRDGGFSARRDAGPRDSGPMCVDEGAGAGCATATDLGAVPVGGTAMSMNGVIPVAGGEDWYAITFAPLGSPMTFGGGMPTLQFTTNEGEQFRFDVMSACGTPVSCGMGGTAGVATGLTQYTFTDSLSMPGEAQWSTRDSQWPTSLKIRVYRTSMGASCDRYVLHASR